MKQDVKNGVAEKLEVIAGRFMLAFMPVLEKFADKLSEPEVINALVVGAEFVVDKLVKDIKDIPEEIKEQEKLCAQRKLLVERRQKLLDWVKDAPTRLKDLPYEQQVMLAEEFPIHFLVTYDENDKRIVEYVEYGKEPKHYYSDDPEAWKIPGEE